MSLTSFPLTGKFYQIVTQDFDRYPGCRDSIRSSWAAIDSMFSSNKRA